MSPIAILFANLKGNLGDFAILHAMLADLGKRYPGHPIHVYPHPFHPLDDARVAAFRKDAPAFQLMDRSPTVQVGLLHRLFSKLQPRGTAQAAQVAHFVARNRKFFEPLSQAEAVVFAGGDQWSGRDLGICMFGSLLAVAQGSKCRLEAYPFSMKTSIRTSYPSGFVASAFENLRQPILARDSGTTAILADLGVRAKQTVDSVYGLSKYVASEIYPSKQARRDRILLVVKADVMASLRAARLLRDQNVPIELLTTCEPEDGVAYRTISAELGIPCHSPLTWQNVVSEMMSSKLVVTNRLHGLILGSLAGVPILPVCSRPKARAFTADAQISTSVPTLGDLTSEVIQKSVGDRDATVSGIRRYREQCETVVATAFGQ